MKNLIKSLAHFQSIVTPIKKDTTNPFFKSHYASLENIQEHIKPFLIKAGLVVIQRNIFNEQLFVETKVIDVVSGENEISLFPVIVSKNDAQSYGSAVSYAKRYSLSGLLNLTIQDSDDDGNKAVEPKKEETIWLTEEQFKVAEKSDKKGIEAVLKKYSGNGFSMKKEYREKLQSLIK
jgi:hypothetical protein